MGRKPSAKAAMKRMPLLPDDLVTQLLPFLSWKQTRAMAQVCVHWRSLMLHARSVHAQWRTTVLSAGNAVQAVELLRSNAQSCLHAQFEPELVMITIGSADTTPFQRGKLWEMILHSLESEQLLPWNCVLLGCFSPHGVQGIASDSSSAAAISESTEADKAVYEFEYEPDARSRANAQALTLVVTTAALPQTTIETAVFERKELRQAANGRGDLENPFAGHSSDPEATSLLLFSVNAGSASSLLPVVAQWYPGAPLVGSVLPFADCCSPIAVYRPQYVAPTPAGRRKQRPRSSASLNSQRSLMGRLEFPSTLLVRLHGDVRLHPFGSCGFQPVTPVVRCERAPMPSLRGPFACYTYGRVSVRGEELTLMDLLDYQDGTLSNESTFNMYSCADAAGLHAIARGSGQEMHGAASEAPINRVSMFVSMEFGEVLSFDTQWQEGEYGVMAVQSAAAARVAHERALDQIRQHMNERQHRPLSAFMATCIEKRSTLYQELDVESRIFESMFPYIGLQGCFSVGEIGPIALPRGAKTASLSSALLQTNSTCGVIVYLKQK